LQKNIKHCPNWKSFKLTMVLPWDWWRDESHNKGHAETSWDLELEKFELNT